MLRSRRASGFSRDVAVVGGGRAGLRLALALADRGVRVAIHDAGEPAVAALSAGRMPFSEPGAALILERTVATGYLVASADPRIVRGAEHVVLAMPDQPEDPGGIARAVGDCAANLRDGQILILRTAAGPGDTAQLEKIVAELGVDVDIAFCPERAGDGQAVTDLFAVPQIVSSRTERGLERASRLLAVLAPVLVPMQPEEAELAVLFASAWQYVRIAAANQLYMLANDRGLDFERIRRGMVLDQPRGAGLPPAGCATGPRLLPDTVRLVAAGQTFPLGRAAIDANEGLAGYLVRRLEQRYDLRSLTVGILGMASPGEGRCGLPGRLRQLLAGRARTVLCTDPLASTDPALLPLDEVLARADLLIVGVPHPEYRSLVTEKPSVDIYNILARGVPA